MSPLPNEITKPLINRKRDDIGHSLFNIMYEKKLVILGQVYELYTASTFSLRIASSSAFNFSR